MTHPRQSLDETRDLPDSGVSTAARESAASHRGGDAKREASAVASAVATQALPGAPRFGGVMGLFRPLVFLFSGLGIVRLRRWITVIVLVFVCVSLLLVLHHLSNTVDYRTVVRGLRALSPGVWVLSVAATAVSYVALVGRDAVALRYIGARVPAPALCVGAAVGSALGNVTGFGALTGGAIRCRVYGTTGVSAPQVGRLTVFSSVTLALTLALMTGVAMLGAAPALAPMFRLPAGVLHVLGGVLVLGFVVLVALCGSTPRTLATARVPWLAALKFDIPTRRVLIAEVAVSVVDVVAAGLALWVILPHTDVAFANFIAIYAAALLLGMIGHTPGGVGIFEAAMMFALGRSMPANEMVIALLSYRAIYFVLPLVLSAGLLASFEGHLLSARFARVRPRRIAWMAPVFLSMVIFAVGSMLVFSGAMPAYKQRLQLLSHFLPLWVLESSQLLASVMGVSMLFVARGLLRRLDGAWWVATVLVAANLALSLSKGLAFVEATVLAIVLLLMIASRRQFNRSSSLFAERFTAGWLVSVGIVIGLSIWLWYFAFRDLPESNSWMGYAFDERAPRAMRATAGAVLFAAVLAVWQLLRPARGRFVRPAPAELFDANRIYLAQERSDAGLAMMGDKSFLFSASRQAFLMYAKRGRTWAALHDPVGPREEWAGLIRDFVAMAHAHGGRAAFYQVRADALPLYLDAGLMLLKLGEEAQLDLSAFDMIGPHRANLRYAVKRGEKDGLSVAVLPPEEVSDSLPTLRRISDAWLASRDAKEKSFSVAAFLPAFVSSQPVMVVSQNGVPVAFAAFMTTGSQTEATIGVMRHVPEASSYTMEYLFTMLALHLKQSGFQKLSLGMSPLAGMTPSPLASVWFRLASLTWQYGGRFYNFRGLRAFKNKFQPNWEPRYLAASGSASVLFTLADLSLLAGGWRS